MFIEEKGCTLLFFLCILAENKNRKTMASRKIFIKRRPNNTKIPDDLYKESTRKIGGKLTSSGEVLRGLTLEEEKKWLAGYLSISPDDVNFRKRVQEFWSNITITVNPGAGTEMEIGLENNEPIDLMSYVKYRFLLKCPEVAENESAMRADPTKKYYIDDPVIQKEKKYNSLQKEKEAYKAFILLTSDEKNDSKLKHMFRMLTGNNPDVFEKQDMEMALDKIAKESPELFLKYHVNKNLEMEAMIAEAVSYEIINKFGESYRYFDQMLGDNIESATAYLMDKKNSELLVTIKQKIREKNRVVKTPEKVEG